VTDFELIREPVRRLAPSALRRPTPVPVQRPRVAGPVDLESMLRLRDIGGMDLATMMRMGGIGF